MAELVIDGIKISTVLCKLGNMARKVNQQRNFCSLQLEDEETKNSDTYTFVVDSRDVVYDYENMCNQEEHKINFPQDYLNDEVLEVRRYCSSKTGYFPSGIITILTQPLFGYAYRHEYIILKTRQRLIKICVPNQSLKNRRGQKYATPKIFIKILQLHDSEGQPLDEQKLYDQLNKNEQYDRVMGEIKDDKILKGLRLNTVITMIRLWRCIHIEQKSMDSLVDCKSLSRTLFYFCHIKQDTKIILCSLFGLYSDKPLYIGAILNLDGILVEEATLRIYKQAKKEDWENSIKLIQQIIDGQHDLHVQDNQ